MLLIIHFPVADEQSLALHHYLNLGEIVAYQCRTRADNIKDTICQTDTRANLHRTSDDVNVGIDIVLLHELAQDVRIRGSNLLAIKPLQSWIINLLRDGKTQAALAETQSVDNLCVFTTLNKLIFTHNTDVGNARGYALRNIVIAEIEHLQREITCLHQKSAL